MANKIDTRFAIPAQTQRESSSPSQETIAPPAQRQAAAVARTPETVLTRRHGKDGFNALEQNALPGLRELGRDAPHTAIPQRGLGFETRPLPTPTPLPDTVEVKGSATPGSAIHGKQTTTSTIHIDQDVKVGKLELGLNLSHSKTSGLTVTITSPAGTTATVPIKQGSKVDATFDLSAFAGESSKGDWKLKVNDSSKSDSGKLNAWSLDITGGTTPTPTPTPVPPIVLPNVPGRPADVTELEGILTINKYEGVQHGRNGDHEIAEATLTTINVVNNKTIIDTRNVHLAMNIASAKDPAGLPHEIPLAVGTQIEVEGEYIPAKKANAKNDQGAAAVLHFTHEPAGYVIIDGQKYQ